MGSDIKKIIGNILNKLRVSPGYIKLDVEGKSGFYEELKTGDTLMAGDVIINSNPYCINVLRIDKVTKTYSLCKGMRYPRTKEVGFKPIPKRGDKFSSPFNQYIVVRKVDINEEKTEL